MSRWVLAVCLLVSACGGVTAPGNGSSSREPKEHRSTSNACPAPPTPIDPNRLAAPHPFLTCTSDAECVGDFHGRCVQQRGGFACAYDDCYSDAQCAGGAVCECRGSTLGNACLPSGCRVDADCPGSWCSPTMGTCGAYSGTIGYQCHTPQDECTDDADCAPNMGAAGYCMHSPEAGHWVCGYGQCVG